MKFPSITPLSSSAVSEELAAALASAVPGMALSLPLGDGLTALLTLTSLRKTTPAGAGMPPFEEACRNSPRRLEINGQLSTSKREAKRLSREAQFVEITNRIRSGKARSVDAAALQLDLGPGGTHANQANYIARLYRKKFCLSASAFSRNQNENSEDRQVTACCNGASKFENRKEHRMHQTENAIQPGTLQRIIPRHFLIDLRAEDLGDATTEEILSPDFWQEAKSILRLADIVTLIRGDATTLDVQVSPYPDGSISVIDLAAHGLPVPEHPDLAAKLANKEAPNANPV